MTEKEISFASWCANNNPLRFYKSTMWKHTQRAVLQMDKHECQLCKEKYHRFRRANTVHHVNHFKQRPDLATEIWYTDSTGVKRRNLISLCHDCHEEAHGWRCKGADEEPLTEERWD